MNEENKSSGARFVPVRREKKADDFVEMDDDDKEEEYASLAITHINQLAAEDNKSDEANRDTKNSELQQSESDELESEQVILPPSPLLSPPTKWESELESFVNFP